MAGTSYSEPGATRLSHPKPLKSGGSAAVRALARLSLISLMMALVAAGCVVPDPPEYGVARQTPPFLDLSTAKVFELKEYKTTDTIPPSISVGVRSEDAGDNLFAQLILNYSVTDKKNSQLLGVAFIPASTFDDLSRQINITFNVPDRPGCQQMSLVVTHVSNLTQTNEPQDFGDVGIATWWLSIDDDDDTALLSKCPREGASL